MLKIFLNVLFLILGLGFLIKGADWFVGGSSSIAKRLKISPFIIGLTIVSFGTSAPELSVSLASAISGSADISVGNIIGSNLFNFLMVLGFSAIFVPIIVDKSVIKREFPFLLMTMAVLLAFSFDVFLGDSVNIIGRGEGIVLVLLLILYVAILIKSGNKEEFKEEILTEQPLWQAIVFFVIGLGLVVFGGECVTQTSKFLAMKMGMSETLVGLTIVALGTSLPELMTSIIAAKKGENDIALGNVLGSIVFNVLMILGLTSIITPLAINNLVLIDMVIMMIVGIIVYLFAATKKGISRLEGAILILIYVGYVTYIVLRNYL